MDGTNQYIAALKASRCAERDGRDQRRRRRIDFLTQLEKKRTHGALKSLIEDIRLNEFTSSSVEKAFIAHVTDTVKWWPTLASNAIERKMTCERVEQEKIYLHEEYLRSVGERENAEEGNLVSSDECRWRMEKEKYERNREKTKEEAVNGVLEDILERVRSYIEYVDAHSIAERKDRKLISLALMDTSKSWAAEELLRELFGQAPFAASSKLFLQLFKLMYDACFQKQDPPTLYDITHVPIFIIDGPKFSGKSCASDAVRKAYELLCFSAKDLLARAISEYHSEKDDDSLEGSITQIVATEILKENSKELFYSSNTIRGERKYSSWGKIGRFIEETLSDGGSVPHSAIAQLVRLQIKSLPQDCRGAIFDGVLTRAKEYQDLKEALIPVVAHPFSEKLKLWCQEANVLQEFNDKHFLIEKIPPEEHPISKREMKSKIAKKNTDLNTLPPPVLPEVVEEQLSPEEQEIIERFKKEKGSMSRIFSSFIHLYCGYTEIFRRFAGRRIDKETREEYHLQYCPPPPERIPYLQNVDRAHACTAHLSKVAFSQERDWSQLFHEFRKSNTLLSCVHDMDAEAPIDEIIANTKQVFQDELNKFEAERNLYQAALAAYKHLEALAAKKKTQELAREAERKRLTDIYTERGVPIPEALEPPRDPEKYYPLPLDLPHTFLTSLTRISGHYMNAYQWVATHLSLLAKLLFENRDLSNQCLTQFWSLPDDKQEILDRFVRRYNNIPSSIRSNVACKEEFHTLIDTLNEELYKSVDAKRKDCVNVIETITRKDTFADLWEVSVCNIGLIMAQLEAEKFSGIVNLSILYFTSLLNEPFMYEDTEMAQNPLRPAAETVPEVNKGKEKRTLASRKGHKVEELVEKSVEDNFVEALTKVEASMTFFHDRLKVCSDVTSKGQKKGGAAPALRAVKIALVASRCLPIAEKELEASISRIRAIRTYILDFVQRGQSYCTQVREEILENAEKMFISQASAVNTAIYTLRGSVEEERPAPSVHLGCGTFFAENPTATTASQWSCSWPSFSQEVPTSPNIAENAPEPEQEVKIHPTLSSFRLFDLIRALRTVAPHYQLPQKDFSLLVRHSDFAGASTDGKYLKSLDEVFQAFDRSNTGAIDWRELIMHLLFWCAPASTKVPVEKCVPNFSLPEAPINQLLETREDLGTEPMPASVFCDVPFFFDKYLEDAVLETYTYALWMTFSDRNTLLLEPYALLAFLCEDIQPVRGVQKAFLVLSQDSSGEFTEEEMYKAFHVLANNPENTHQADPFSRECIRLLFAGREKVSFQYVCENAIGRKMLNSVHCYHRKSFVDRM